KEAELPAEVDVDQEVVARRVGGEHEILVNLLDQLGQVGGRELSLDHQRAVDGGGGEMQVHRADACGAEHHVVALGVGRAELAVEANVFHSALSRGERPRSSSWHPLVHAVPSARKEHCRTSGAGSHSYGVNCSFVCQSACMYSSC